MKTSILQSIYKNSPSMFASSQAIRWPSALGHLPSARKASTKKTIDPSRLCPVWNAWFADIDSVMPQNFYGNLDALQVAKSRGDAYPAQLESMGFDLGFADLKCPKFVHVVNWLNQSLDQIIESNDNPFTEADVLRPGKAFENYDGETLFVGIGEELQPGSKPLNLLKPDVFVQMLASGYFPMGDATVEHTNQSLAEHDMAHVCGFIAQPQFMAAVRQGFNKVSALLAEKNELGSRIGAALSEFESFYSLRLYYLIEVSTFLKTDKLAEFKELLGEAKDAHGESGFMDHFDQLLKKDPSATELYRYLAKTYAKFPSLVEAVGGESRDIHNRERKFHRGETTGTFYDSANISKFNGNSVWSLYLNGQAALHFRRSNHQEFREALTLHARFLSCLNYISELSIDDWVQAAIDPIPDHTLPVIKHIKNTFKDDHLLRLAFTSKDFDKVPTTSPKDIQNDSVGLI